MPYAAVAEKLKSVPEQYLNEIEDFIDFVSYKATRAEEMNGLDIAIKEMENGEYDTYNNFDELLAEVEHET